jgi:3-phenylpropionate/trans-cinnamate dioxygenase ferredoxin subunit
MSRYVPVCALADLEERQPKAVSVPGDPVVVVRIGDDVFAVSDICSHAEIPLSEGTVDAEGSISCWLHGSRFDLRTGEPDEPPAWEPIDVYPTTLTEQHGVQMVAVSPPQTERQA